MLHPLALLAAAALSAAPRPAPSPLQLSVVVADSTSYDVVSTLILGPTEAILVDGQFRTRDAERLADRVVASGRRLTAIVVTHPHDDHYFGLGVLHRRFPDVPIYMTPAGIEVYRRQWRRFAAAMRRAYPADAPDSLPDAQAFPSTHLAVDGQDVEVVADQQGDELVPSNTYLWIPSLRAAVAGDIVFNDVHVWLANSNAQSRRRWIGALDRLAARHPAIVVAGHKRDSTVADSPGAIAFTRRYIAAFDDEAGRTLVADSVVARMGRRYPAAALPAILARAASIAVPD